MSRQTGDVTADSATTNSRTLQAYEMNAELYVERTPTSRSQLVDALLGAVPRGSTVLELGSGPGLDALHLEAGGLFVERTDGARSFVERLRSEGRAARLLDILHDDFGGPFDAVFANAVLLHVPRVALQGVLRSASGAVRVGGILAATVKKGTGEEWTTRKVEAPRYFTYWEEDPLRRMLTSAGWSVKELRESTEEGSAEEGSAERWITFLATKDENRIDILAS